MILYALCFGGVVGFMLGLMAAYLLPVFFTKDKLLKHKDSEREETPLYKISRRSFGVGVGIKPRYIDEIYKSK